MPTTERPRVAIRVSPLPHGPAAAGWTPRRVIGALLVSWGTVAALITAVVLAVVWDLRR
jgi:hypothetical protein